MVTKPLQAASIDKPQETFESALSVVQQSGKQNRGNAVSARTQPIVAAHSEQQREKRALTDAARALATLWKLSPHLVR